MFLSRRFWLGIGATAAFLGALLWRMSDDLGDIGSALTDANYVYLAPALPIYFVALYLRAVRWRYLLRPFGAISVRRLYPVVTVGYMANNLLPMRLGEVVRSYYLARREPVRASTALATVVVERVFDGIALLFLIGVAALFLDVGGLTDRVGDAAHLPVGLVALIVVVPFALALTLIVAGALYPKRVQQTAAFFTRRLPGRFSGRVDALLERFLEGFQGLHRPSRLMAVFLFSMPIWLLEGSIYYLIALGFGLDAHFDTVLLMAAAMLLVTAVSNLATSLPSSQGAVGPFEFFAVLTLEFLGVGATLAFSYTVVLHATLLLPVTAAGLLHLAYASVSLGQLTKREPAGRASAAGKLP